MNAKDAPCRNIDATVELSNCFWEAWQREDKELNSYYLIVAKHLEGNEIEDLRKAERAWLGYRDVNCEAEKALYDGGTAAGPVYNACMEAMTRERLAELKNMYDWRVSQ